MINGLESTNMVTDFLYSQNEVISRQISNGINMEQEQVEFITTLISEFKGSEFRLAMDVAEKYYNNENDILDAERLVIGRDPETGLPVEMVSQVLANNKLCHNFMKKLTRQKIGYLLGKVFTFTEKDVKTDKAEQFFKILVSEYFNKDTFKMLKNVARDSIVKALGWILVYYDENGKLKFKRMNPEEVIPLWADSDHTILDSVIRQYTIESYERGQKKLLKFVDYYTTEAIYHYYYNDNGQLVATDTPVSHNFYIKMKDDETGETIPKGVMWQHIPFIPFKYDPDEKGLLPRIKSLVDDYDKKTSAIANNIDDFPNAMLVVKNYDGASKEEFIHNKNMYRAIFTQGDGDAKTLEMPLDVEKTDIHLKRLREDIYEFGQGVNTADKEVRDTSGVALRFMYADLDLDCLDWSTELEWSITNLVWFVQQDLIAKRQEDYTAVDYNIVFNTDVIINETETIQNCFTSMGVISQETIAANHPWTINAAKEVQDFMSETEENLDLEATYAKKASVAKQATTGQRSAK